MSELNVKYLRMDEVIKMRWIDNIKLHATELIEQSILKFGFNDPLGCDYEHSTLVEGHGRLELLEKLKGIDPKLPPKNVMLDTDGEWLIPTVELKFDDINAAHLYAIAHNRSNTKGFNPNDYRVDKLKAMQAAGQLNLFGFDNMDTAAVLPKFQLPDPKAFDIQNNVEKEWVGMPKMDQEDFKPFRQILVRFTSQEDVDKFAALIMQTVTENTKAMWYPKRDFDQHAREMGFKDESTNVT